MTTPTCDDTTSLWCERQSNPHPESRRPTDARHHHTARVLPSKILAVAEREIRLSPAAEVREGKGTGRARFRALPVMFCVSHALPLAPGVSLFARGTAEYPVRWVQEEARDR